MLLLRSLAFSVVLLCTVRSIAVPITAVSDAGGWLTFRTLKGNVGLGHAGEEVRLNYGTPPTVVATGKVDSVGDWTIVVPATVPAAAAGTLTSTIAACPGPSPITVASLLKPPDNSAVAVHTILPGSQATLGGISFTLEGTYTLTATAVDYDPLSATYGNLSGAILASAFHVTATNALGTAFVTLSEDQPYTVSMLPLFNAQDFVGTSISFNLPVSGTVTFNQLASPFSGFLTGTSTYGPAGTETFNYSLNLASNFGHIGGTVSSFGTAELVPEPGTLLLLATGLTGTGVALRRRYR